MADVLIIEPSKELALVIAEALARKELTVAIANTSQEAIKLADKAAPKVVIAEILIPKHNGLEFIHEFRSYSDWLNVPIIIYSQISSDELSISAQTKTDMGIAEHFYKSTTSLEKLVNSAEEILH